MNKKQREVYEFLTSFYESVLRRMPNYLEAAEILGGIYTRLGRYADGLRIDRRLVRYQPESPTAHYNLACSLALLRRDNEAIDALERAVELGYSDAQWMSEDEDLKSLHGRPEFAALLSQAFANA